MNSDRHDLIKAIVEGWDLIVRSSGPTERPLVVADRMAWQHVNNVRKATGRELIGGHYSLHHDGELKVDLEFGPPPPHYCFGPPPSHGR